MYVKCMSLVRHKPRSKQVHQRRHLPPRPMRQSCWPGTDIPRMGHIPPFQGKGSIVYDVHVSLWLHTQSTDWIARIESHGLNRTDWIARISWREVGRYLHKTIDTYICERSFCRQLLIRGGGNACILLSPIQMYPRQTLSRKPHADDTRWRRIQL
jgi:hypothetical protein